MKNTIVNKKIHLGLSLITVAGTLLLGGCNDKVSNPEAVIAPETFTTVILNYANKTDAADKMSDTIKFTNGFGHGDSLAKNQIIKLKANTTYAVHISMLDETKSPADDKDVDVHDLSDIHQLFFTPAGINVAVTYDDHDKNNHPVGLETTEVTGAAGTGTIKVTLKHQIDGSTPLKASINWTAHPMGDITVGETDVEVTFNATIQ